MKDQKNLLHTFLAGLLGFILLPGLLISDVVLDCYQWDLLVETFSNITDKPALNVILMVFYLIFKLMLWAGIFHVWSSRERLLERLFNVSIESQ